MPRYFCTHQCPQWTEGEIYIARVETGGFIVFGDDDAPNGEGWSASPVEYRDDGSILYQLGGLDGDVIFEEYAA
ncbi:hypothetical protein R0H02_11740 [Phytobacter ursingii]|uniref:Phage protein n=1 Tax=Phytobacter ursingii TaxID=1972431 RepID=A0AB35RMC2_9ENTR|nr:MULTISPECIES: hypothetical protein [Enterobacteriaceae]MDV2863135.1 hypothetical protein [Phytobacter ursingii]